MSRVVEEGAIYHIYCRGNNKAKVFVTSDDYRKYIRNLAIYKMKYKFKLYAHALIPNHPHLLIEPSGPDELSRIMRSLNTSYSMWHNRRYDCVGHVWQGRFGSRIIKDDRDFLTCLAYIEMNPVRAGLVDDPESYKWSSCYERFHTTKDSLIDMHPAYMELGETEQERRCRYYEIMYKDGP